jgi:membrane protease YdiL (CAAX protease family)
MTRWGAPAIVAVGLLLAAAAIEVLRPFVLLALGVGFLAIWWSSRRDRPGAPSSAFTVGACLLVTMSLAWTGVDLPAAARDGSTCTDPLAPFAAYRVVGAVIVLTSLALLVRLLGSTAEAIGIRRASPRTLAVAAGALAAIGAVAVVIGPAVAEPFFGPLPVRLGDPAALVPALLFAIANGAMEEVAYRGMLLRGLMRWSGPVLALGVQAAVFGLAHGVGSDFAGSPLPVMAATAAGGVAFGVIALRTGSLVMPIALHAALDVPIYYANACLQVSG